MGVSFRYGNTISGFTHAGDRITSVETEHGPETADAYVCALGPYAPILLRAVGIRLPIYPIKGYSITLPVTDDAAAPQSTLMDETHKVAITRLGDRIRVAGRRRSSATTPSSGRRRPTRSLRGQRPLPQGGRRQPRRGVDRLRPMTPDGTPVIGPTRYSNLFLNTGHGTLGWTMACGSRPRGGRRGAGADAGDFLRRADRRALRAVAPATAPCITWRVESSLAVSRGDEG